MTQTELRNRIVAGLRERKRTLSEIASRTGQPEKIVRPAILVMQTEGLVRAEGECYILTPPTEPEKSAQVQNLAAPQEECVTAESTSEGEEQKDRPEQDRLVKKFRAALKAADDAEASVLAAERKSCAKHHRLGKIALDLKSTFRHGEWGPFLEAENVDQNRINRAMRLAKYLPEDVCDKMPILEAEILIRKIRNNPADADIAAMADMARKEYEAYRRDQLRKMTNEILVDLVAPKAGHYYLTRSTCRGRAGFVVHVTDVRCGAQVYGTGITGGTLE